MDPILRKYRLKFDPAVELIRTGNDEADIMANTALFTKIIEDYVLKYPGQWLWVHRRWKDSAGRTAAALLTEPVTAVGDPPREEDDWNSGDQRPPDR